MAGERPGPTKRRPGYVQEQGGCGQAARRWVLSSAYVKKLLQPLQEDLNFDTETMSSITVFWISNLTPPFLHF